MGLDQDMVQRAAKKDWESQLQLAHILCGDGIDTFMREGSFQ